MKSGVILRGIGGFYDVLSDGEVFRCRARGRFRRLGISPMVGDRVRFQPETEISEGIMEEILPRRNAMKRPAVANVDQLVLVLSASWQWIPNRIFFWWINCLSRRNGRRFRHCLFSTRQIWQVRRKKWPSGPNMTGQDIQSILFPENSISAWGN